VANVEFFEQGETFHDEKQVSGIEISNFGTSERGQSCNVLCKNSQPICGNGGFVRDIE